MEDELAAELMATRYERTHGRIAVLNNGRVVAQDTPDGLKHLVTERNGGAGTLHNVFMTYTGRSLDDDVEEAEPYDD